MKWMMVLAVAASLGLAAGCDTTRKVTDNISGVEKASVTVPFEALGEDVTVTVTSSGNEASKAGVRLLGGGNYPEAKEQLGAALEKSPEDVRSRFAMGVVCEVLGDLPAAREHYAFVATHGDDEQYQSALSRIKVKLGEKTL